MNFANIVIIILLIFIILLILFVWFHPYSIFLFKTKLLNYKTIFNKTDNWNIEINPKNITSEFLYFLQYNGYNNVDYFEDDKKMINYLFGNNGKDFSKDNSILFLFRNRTIKNIGAMVLIIKIKNIDSGIDYWYIDHIAIENSLRKKQLQTEILIYIYQYFAKNNKNCNFLIQKSAKPSKSLFPYNFKTSYSVLESLNDIMTNKEWIEKQLNLLSPKLIITNHKLQEHKINNCFLFKINSLYTFWFSYPEKRKNNKRFELVFWDNKDKYGNHKLNLLDEIKNYKNINFILPIEFKNKIKSVHRFWYHYPFFKEKLFQSENKFIPLI